MKKNLLILAGLFFVLSSCEKTDSETYYSQPEKIIIPNYGKWYGGDATLSVFYYKEDSVLKDAYSFFNNGKLLGNGAQSIFQNGNYLYLCMFDDSKIIVLDSETLKEVKVIEAGEGSQPNYMALGSDGFLYATDFGKNQIIKINSSDWEIKNRINVGKGPWQIVTSNNYLFVANNAYGADSTISVIDPITASVKTTIQVGIGPTYLFRTNNSIIVQCSGDSFNGKKGSFWKIDPSTQTKTDSVFVSTNPFSEMSLDGSSIYYNDFGVKRINLNGKMTQPENFSEINAVPFFDSEKHKMYGIKFDENKSTASLIRFFGNQIEPDSEHELGIYPSGSYLIIYKTYKAD